MSSLNEWQMLLHEQGVAMEGLSNECEGSLVDTYTRIVESTAMRECELHVEDIVHDDLGHLSLDDQPVFAYIRRGRKVPKARRVHFTYCQAITSNPADKYFCTTRCDGEFEIDIEDRRGNVVETMPLSLEPCEFCIGKYYGLNRRKEDKAERLAIIEKFEYDAIFAEIGKTLNTNAWRSTLYQFTDKPWEDISREVREKSNWTCERCRLHVGEECSVFLHAHHIAADRNFNHTSNLVALCILCHADEPGHEKMKGQSQYQQFLKDVRLGKFKKVGEES